MLQPGNIQGLAKRPAMLGNKSRLETAQTTNREGHNKSEKDVRYLIQLICPKQPKQVFQA